MNTLSFYDIKRLFKNPRKIIRYIKRQIVRIPYYVGSGKFALPPLVVKLYVNTKCNCRCNFCDIGKKEDQSIFSKQMFNNNSGDINEQTLDKFIKEFSKHKPIISISGLEPLLHNDIIGILIKLRNAGFKLNLVTNGILLDKYADELIKLNIDSINVSIDGPREIHDHIRGVEVYNKAINGLKSIKIAKQKYKAKTQINVLSCVSPDNYSVLEVFASELLMNGISEKVSFTYLYFISPAACELHNRNFKHIGSVTVSNYSKDYENIDTTLVHQQLSRLKNRFKNKIVINNNYIHSSNDLAVYFRSPLEKIGKNKCFIPWTRATVMSDGTCIIHNRCIDYEVGNIRNQTFNEIWGGEKYRYFRQQLKTNKLFPACYRCCGVAK